MNHEYRKSNGLSKRKSSILHRFSNHHAIPGDGTWQILQPGLQKQQQYLQHQQEQQKLQQQYQRNYMSQFPSVPEIIAKKKKKLKSKNRSVTHKARNKPSKTLLKPSANITYNMGRQKPSYEQMITLFENTNSKNCKNDCCNKNNEDENEYETDKFYETVRKSVENGLKKAIETHMLRHFENLYNQFDTMLQWMTTMNDNYKLLATELNDKVTNYGQDHSRRLSKILMKLECDNEHSVPVSSKIKQQLPQLELPHHMNRTVKASSQRMRSGGGGGGGDRDNNRRRRTYEKTPKNSERTPKLLSPSTDQRLSLKLNSSSKAPSSINHKKLNRDNCDNILSSMTLEQILKVVGNLQPAVASSAKNKKSAGHIKSKTLSNKNHCDSSSTMTEESRRPCNNDSDDSSSEARINYRQNGRKNDSSEL